MYLFRIKRIFETESGWVYFILLLGFALRLFAAGFRIPIVHPDEHFQTLEPAARVALGYGWLTWEWQVGLRSWLIPGLYMPVLLGFKALGVNGGLMAIVGCRILMAVVSVWMLREFHKLLRQFGFSVPAALFGLWLLTLSPTMIAWSITTLSDTWAWLILWIVLPTFFKHIQNPGRRSWLLAGLLATLPFLARIQMILFPFAFGVALLVLYPKQRRYLMPFGAGCALVVFFQGVFDWLTWKHFLHSVLTNLEYNLVKGVASQYGTSPWYGYLSTHYEKFGSVQLIPLLLMLVFGAGLGLILKRKRPTALTWLLMAPSLLYFIVHALIPHKEARFLLPLLPLLFFSGPLFLDALLTFQPAWGTAMRRNRAWLVATLPVLLLYATTHIYSDKHQYLFDLSFLSNEVRKDGQLTRPKACLLLVNHHWIWTRGELMQGRPFKYEEVDANRPISPTTLETCVYAIVLKTSERRFMAQAGENWKPLAQDRAHVLYKNQLKQEPASHSP